MLMQALPFVGKILSISISEKLDSVPQARRIAVLHAFSAVSKGKSVQRFHVFFMVVQRIYKMSQAIHSETLLDIFHTFVKILVRLSKPLYLSLQHLVRFNYLLFQNGFPDDDRARQAT